MSRISQFPPRRPQARGKEDELRDLIRFPSLGTILEEQPSWLDELLADSDVNPKGTLHRRSASDSAAILEDPTDLQCPISSSSEEASVSTIVVTKPAEMGEICSGLEGGCVYGPNSPRHKSTLSNSEVSALMESIPPNKLQYVTVDFPGVDSIKQPGQKCELQISAGDVDPEKAAR